MKKIMKVVKENILGIVIGGILFGGIGVGATYIYQSNQVRYKDNNVENALNELYDAKLEFNNFKTIGNATADNITKDKTAIIGGKLVTGSGKDSQTSYDQGYAAGYAAATSTASKTINIDMYIEGGRCKGYTKVDNTTVTSLATGDYEGLHGYASYVVQMK